MNSIIASKIEERLKSARTQTEPLKAIQGYQQILFLNRNHLITYKELAQQFVKIGDLSAAINCLLLSQEIKYDILIEDELQQIVLLKGFSLLEQGDINNFLEGTEHEQFGRFNDFSNVQLQRPYAYILMNYLKHALSELQVIIKQDENNVDALLLRGKLLWENRQYAEGNLDYWKVYSMNPELDEIKEFISFIIPKTNAIIEETKFFIVQRELLKSKLNVKKGLELYPNNKDLLVIRAYLLRQERDYEQALKDLDIALKQDPKNKEIQKQISITYNEMAMLLFERKNYDDALTLFSEAIKYKQDDWGILVNRGDTYKALYQLLEAYNDYRNAFIINNNQIIYDRLINVLHLLGIDLKVYPLEALQNNLPPVDEIQQQQLDEVQRMLRK